MICTKLAGPLRRESHHADPPHPYYTSASSMHHNRSFPSATQLGPVHPIDDQSKYYGTSWQNPSVAWHMASKTVCYYTSFLAHGENFMIRLIRGHRRYTMACRHQICRILHGISWWVSRRRWIVLRTLLQRFSQGSQSSELAESEWPPVTHASPVNRYNTTETMSHSPATITVPLVIFI